jgi:hypothetical protein
MKVSTLLAKLFEWLKSSGEQSPPYPLSSWSELPSESWPDDYNPLEDEHFKKVNTKGELE